MTWLRLVWASDTVYRDPWLCGTVMRLLAAQPPHHLLLSLREGPTEAEHRRDDIIEFTVERKLERPGSGILFWCFPSDRLSRSRVRGFEGCQKLPPLVPASAKLCGGQWPGVWPAGCQGSVSVFLGSAAREAWGGRACGWDQAGSSSAPMLKEGLGHRAR